jgi:uncharacterized protein
MQNKKMETFYYKDTEKYGKSIFSARKFKKDDVIFTICGSITKNPSFFTVPIDYDLYIDPEFSAGKNLNHSCNPSCGIKNRTRVVAMRDLEKDEEITIDYAMIVPRYDNSKLKQDIQCNCGSNDCRGKFGSYEELPEQLREKYKGYISDYLTDD